MGPEIFFVTDGNLVEHNMPKISGTPMMKNNV